MSSKTINSMFAAGALIAGTAFVTATVTGDHHKQDGMHAMTEGMSPEEAAFMAKWMEYMTPTEHHTELMQYAGHWKMETKMWMDPAAPPETATHRVSVEPILGGRYLLEHVRGEVNGMPFHGMNVSGYDNHKGVYTFAWVDNMGTGIFTGQGSANGDGSVITYMGEKPDFMNPGAMVPVKSVVKHMGKDKMVFEMHDVSPSGEWWKSFEGVYTRAGGDGKGHEMHKGHDGAKGLR